MEPDGTSLKQFLARCLPRSVLSLVINDSAYGMLFMSSSDWSIRIAEVPVAMRLASGMAAPGSRRQKG
jgi:hypothetical protein